MYGTDVIAYEVSEEEEGGGGRELGTGAVVLWLLPEGDSSDGTLSELIINQAPSSRAINQAARVLQRTCATAFDGSS